MINEEKQRFMRKPLTCPNPKCQSIWMDERQVREMFVSPYKGGVPLYSGGTKTRIYCGQCGGLVWKEGIDKKEKKDEVGEEQA